MAPTEGQLATWDATLWAILGEMNEAYGETSAHQYPPEPEMALRLAWLAVDRQLTEMRVGALAIPVPPRPMTGPTEFPAKQELPDG